MFALNSTPDQAALKNALQPGDVAKIVWADCGTDEAGPIPLLNVEPALPHQIQPGATETLYFTFAKPGVNTAVLRMLTFSSDCYF